MGLKMLSGQEDAANQDTNAKGTEIHAEQLGKHVYERIVLEALFPSNKGLGLTL